MDHRIIFDQVVESHGAAAAQFHGYWVAMYQSNEPLPEALEGSPRVALPEEDWKWVLTYVAPTSEEAIAQLNDELGNLGIDPPEPKRAEPVDEE